MHAARGGVRWWLWRHKRQVTREEHFSRWGEKLSDWSSVRLRLCLVKQPFVGWLTVVLGLCDDLIRMTLEAFFAKAQFALRVEKQQSPAYARMGSGGLQRNIIWNALFQRSSHPGIYLLLGVYFPICRGTFKISNRRERYVYILLISKYSNLKYKVLLKIQWSFVVLLSLFVIRNFRGTCSSVEMLKGCMVRERLGTPGIARQHTFKVPDA